ncbi:hypothetical protein CR513_36821, partial [Mucuna pruriens]
MLTNYCINTKINKQLVPDSTLKITFPTQPTVPMTIAKHLSTIIPRMYTIPTPSVEREILNGLTPLGRILDFPRGCKCTKIFYKSPIKTCKPMEASQFPHGFKYWSLLDSLHLFLINVDSMVGNNKAKEEKLSCRQKGLLLVKGGRMLLYGLGKDVGDEMWRDKVLIEAIPTMKGIVTILVAQFLCRFETAATTSTTAMTRRSIVVQFLTGCDSSGIRLHSGSLCNICSNSSRGKLLTNFVKMNFLYTQKRINILMVGGSIGLSIRRIKGYVLRSERIRLEELREEDLALSKCKISPFLGNYNPKTYVDWELKVEQILGCFNLHDRRVMRLVTN